MDKREHNKHGIIGRDRVRLVPQAAMLDCGTDETGAQARPMAVVPLLEGDVVAGFEVRCGCGASVIVECVYESTERRPSATPIQEPSP